MVSADLDKVFFPVSPREGDDDVVGRVKYAVCGFMRRSESLAINVLVVVDQYADASNWMPNRDARDVGVLESTPKYVESNLPKIIVYIARYGIWSIGEVRPQRFCCQIGVSLVILSLGDKAEWTLRNLKFLLEQMFAFTEIQELKDRSAV
jgi:hypothetical protein